MRPIPNQVCKLSCGKRVFAVFVLCAATAVALHGQTFTTLVTFDDTNGGNPVGALIQAVDGNLYGTTNEGGAYGNGTIFKITPSGTLTTLYAFCPDYNCAGGGSGAYGLGYNTNGDLYGTTYGAGAYNDGTIYRATLQGAVTTLDSFSYGSGSEAALVQATNGNLYGATAGGGYDNCSPYSGCGTLFEVTAGGTLTTLYSFCAQNGCADGEIPVFGALVQATNGNLYGTTFFGGAQGDGTIFEITPAGKLTTLHSFSYTDGGSPWAGLIQASDGNLYGSTYFGGANGEGTVFKITTGGTLTTLYSFCSESGCADGQNPIAGLVQATDGNFYGTTSAGGANGNYGTIYKITAGGTLTTLHSFDGADGQSPMAALSQDTDGNFYGTTSVDGGNYPCNFNGLAGCGTVFSLSVGLGPFVETLPAFGKLGAAVKILGTKLTGATSVTFNGTEAEFKVVSASLITTTVPQGATTGTVEVVTPKGTLKSNVVFRVTK